MSILKLQCTVESTLTQVLLTYLYFRGFIIHAFTLLYFRGPLSLFTQLSSESLREAFFKKKNIYTVYTKRVIKNIIKVKSSTTLTICTSKIQLNYRLVITMYDKAKIEYLYLKYNLPWILHNYLSKIWIQDSHFNRSRLLQCYCQVYLRLPWRTFVSPPLTVTVITQTHGAPTHFHLLKTVDHRCRCWLLPLLHGKNNLCSRLSRFLIWQSQYTEK